MWCQAVFRHGQHLAVAPVQLLPLSYYLLLIAFGAALGLFGAFYNKTLLFSQRLYAKLSLSQPVKMMIPFAFAGLFGLFLPQVLGGGHGMIESLLRPIYPGAHRHFACRQICLFHDQLRQRRAGRHLLPAARAGLAFRCAVWAAGHPSRRCTGCLCRQFHAAGHGGDVYRHRARPAHRHHPHRGNVRLFDPAAQPVAGFHLRISCRRSLPQQAGV